MHNLTQLLRNKREYNINSFNSKVCNFFVPWLIGQWWKKKNENFVKHGNFGYNFTVYLFFILLWLTKSFYLMTISFNNKYDKRNLKCYQDVPHWSILQSEDWLVYNSVSFYCILYKEMLAVCLFAHEKKGKYIRPHCWVVFLIFSSEYLRKNNCGYS